MNLTLRFIVGAVLWLSACALGISAARAQATTPNVSLVAYNCTIFTLHVPTSIPMGSTFFIHASPS